MSDNLVKRLRGWAKDIQEGSTAIWAMDQDLKEAADRIEELEAKLEQAEWLLVDAMVQLEDGKIKTRRNRAHLIGRFLAELKGEKE